MEVYFWDTLSGAPCIIIFLPLHGLYFQMLQRFPVSHSSAVCPTNLSKKVLLNLLQLRILIFGFKGSKAHSSSLELVELNSYRVISWFQKICPSTLQDVTSNSRHRFSVLNDTRFPKAITWKGYAYILNCRWEFQNRATRDVMRITLTAVEPSLISYELCTAQHYDTYTRIYSCARSYYLSLQIGKLDSHLSQNPFDRYRFGYPWGFWHRRRKWKQQRFRDNVKIHRIA